MNPKITEHEVFLYQTGLLPDDRRREVEAAYDTDPQVQEWFDEYAVEDESSEPPADPKPLDLDDPQVMERLMLAYEIVMREDVEQAEPSFPDPFTIEPKKWYDAGGGVLLYREVVGLAADNPTIDLPPSGCPLVYIDHNRRFLTVRQPLDVLPDGRVDIVVRRRRGNDVQEFTKPGCQLRKAKHCWYADVPLHELIPDTGWKRPADEREADEQEDIVYAVQPSRPSDPNTRTGG